MPARIPIESPRGEVLLLERREDGTWEALARPTRRLRAGRRYGPVELLEHLGEGRWRLRLDGEPAGETPLPPYITEPLGDPSRYQTVYAREPGSAAAPTAGLHFTPELLARLDPARVTLHVGLDTFRPVTEERLEEHRIHGERYEVAPEAWERIRAAERVLAVGTTTVRVLETLARGGPLAGRTELFITPGFEFRRVDALLTNFHLPALDAARPRDGLRGNRGDAAPLPARRRGAVPLLLLRRCNADPVRPRSANEWRDFWRDGGERELHAQLEEFAPYSVRIATLLGSNAPERALVAELGRIREHELNAASDPERDAEVGSRVYAWFVSASVARSATT